MFTVNPSGRRFRRIVAALLGFLMLLPPELGVAQMFDGKWFRVRGRWNGLELQAQSLQLREDEDDTAEGQISGIVDVADFQNRTFRVGPFTVQWQDTTEFDGEASDTLHEGSTVKIAGRLIGPDRFAAKSVKLETDPYGQGVLQVTGLSTSAREHPDGTRTLEVLGVPVHTTQNGYNIFKSLTRRQDARRPDNQLRVDLFGRPLTVGGEYTLTPWLRDNLDLDEKDPDSVLRLSQELKLEFFYPITEFTVVFLSFAGVGQSDLRLNGSKSDEHEYDIARDETWIFFERIWNSPFSLQFGRQNVAETRSWWWDKDLDSLRVYSDYGPLHVEVAAGQQLGAESTIRSIDQVDSGVARVLGLASYMWASKQRLELFALHQWDHSRHEDVGSVFKSRNEDDSDADLTWFGARAIGDRNLGGYGALLYWLDSGWVMGHETALKFDEVDDTRSRTRSKNRQKVRGWAMDAGMAWTLPVPLSPTLTAGYARGSGDTNPDDGVDNSFHQTGLHRNKWRFRGVNRFRYYGELLRPELSNLGIFTGALGFPMLRNSSLELVYHKYDQVEAADSLRDTRLNTDPDGKSRDIGEEWDLVLNFREYKQVEYGFIGSVFNPGAAFGKSATPSFGIQFDFAYTF